MNRLQLFLTLIIAIITASSAAAQTAAEPKPVEWTMTVSMTGATEGTATITATPAKGWHLYGTDIPAGGPKATVIDLSGSTGVEFTAAPKPTVKPATVDDPLFGIRLTWWEKPVSFTVPFKLAAGRTSGRIKAAVTFMACDDNTCSPPSTATMFKAVKARR